jgi:hypothetical protein
LAYQNSLKYIYTGIGVLANGNPQRPFPHCRSDGYITTEDLRTQQLAFD